MELKTEQTIEEAMREGLSQAVKNQFTSNYDNPIKLHVEEAISNFSGKILELLNWSIHNCLCDDLFVDEIQKSVREVLAKELVKRFGGEVQKQVNDLKSDPRTRERITTALEEIVKR